MDGSGDNRSGSSSGMLTVSIKDTKNTYVATNLYVPQFHSPDSHLANYEAVGHPDAGCESVSGKTANRWTQISGFVPGGLQQANVYCQNFYPIHMHLNKDTLEMLEKCPDMETLTKKLGGMSEVLCRFGYGGDISADAVTAVKINLKEHMLQLMKEVADIIAKADGSKRKIITTIHNAIEKHFAWFLGVDIGCLVFIFKHSLQEDSELMLKSLVCGFLPEWVKEDDIQWEFLRVEPSNKGNIELGKSIQLTCPQTENVPSVGLRAVEEMIEKKMDQYFSSVQEHITKTQAEIFQQFMEHQKIFWESLPSLQHSGDSETPLEIGKHPGFDFAPHTKLPNDFQPGDSAAVAASVQLPGGQMISSKLQKSRDATQTITEPDIKPDSKDIDTKQHGEQYASGLSEKSHDHTGGAFPAEKSHHILDINPDSKDIDTKQHGEQYASGLSEKSHDHTGGAFPAEKSHHISGDSPTKSMGPQDIETKKEVQETGSGDETEQDRSSQSGDEPKAEESTKKNQQSKTVQAEQLLNWVNVKSKASESEDQEIQRMMEQVGHALEDEDNPSPRARALDTVLVLDTSDSVVGECLDELKTIVHTFVDGIEINVDTMNLEENLAVVQIAGRAWVRQHLTNDYNRIRDAVDEMTPDSEMMPTGGRTPLFQALLVCLGAIEGRGGVVNVAGCHRIRPRLIFFTDGRPTDEATETGGDIQSNISEVKFALVQLITEFSSKKHKTTPAPIFWVPVGKNPDLPFLDSVAALSGGKVIPKVQVEELCRYYKVQETIGCVYKMVRKHKDVYTTESQIMNMINALAGSVLSDVEKKYILGEVQTKQKEPESESLDTLDFDNIYEDVEHVQDGSLLPLGTRVKRGPNWKWNLQDSEGAGIVIQHMKKRDGWLRVLWDNGNHNAYRYGDGEYYDVQSVDEPKYVEGPDKIDFGVRVVRGENWKFGAEDGKGKGIVLRKRKDGKVKVRWEETGHIGKYKFDASGNMDVKIDPDVIQPISAQQRTSDSPPAPQQKQGAAKKADQELGPGKRYIWEWKDPSDSQWRPYDPPTQDKLFSSFKKNAKTCVLERDKICRRVLFMVNEEKTVDGGSMVPVRKTVISDEDYLKMSKEYTGETPSG